MSIVEQPDEACSSRGFVIHCGCLPSVVIRGNAKELSQLSSSGRATQDGRSAKAMKSLAQAPSSAREYQKDPASHPRLSMSDKSILSDPCPTNLRSSSIKASMNSRCICFIFVCVNPINGLVCKPVWWVQHLHRTRKLPILSRETLVMVHWSSK